MRKRTVKVSDKFQTGYKYQLTEPAGRNFHPDFKPELTPKQMLALGVFGGVYMRGRSKDGEPSSGISRKSRNIAPVKLRHGAGGRI